MTDWCPETLLDLGQLRDYYLQRVMEEVVEHNNADEVGFSGAIYLDALDKDGRIRTGSTSLWQQVGDVNETNSRNEDDHAGTVGYAYVDTVLLHNVQKACRKDAHADCGSLVKLLHSRRALHPLAKWEEPGRGRHATWPDV